MWAPGWKDDHQISKKGPCLRGLGSSIHAVVGSTYFTYLYRLAKVAGVGLPDLIQAWQVTG